MKKKIFSIISTMLAAIMCFSLVGCMGGGEDPDDGGTTPPPSQGAVKTINFTIETESSVAYQNAGVLFRCYWCSPCQNNRCVP